ncbi:MAG: hypothetical protein ABH950_01445 [Candidatus Altiarchaeota archaeon]
MKKKMSRRKIWMSVLTLLTLITTGNAWVPSNVVLDFDSTAVNTNLRRGDQGVLNLVIENTGDFNALGVEVWIASTSSITADKRVYVGTLEYGASKTMPVLIRVNENAKTGLRSIPVSITYDGYDSLGQSKNDMGTKWEVPVSVYSDPLFEITPSKITYFKDTIDTLILEGVTKDSVKNVEATLTSTAGASKTNTTCLTVLGSSRKFIGDVTESQKFSIKYDVKPAAAGPCTASLGLSYTDESGTTTTDSITLGLNIEDAGVDLKVTDISYEPTGPGEMVTIKVGFKNVGAAGADDLTVGLDFSSPFTPADTPEKYIGSIKAGEELTVEFKVYVGWDADTKTYSIPLEIDYKVGGSSYTDTKDIGIDVGGRVVLEIINVRSSGSSVQIEVANVGTRSADAVKGTLILGGAPQSGSETDGATTPQTPTDFAARRGMRNATTPDAETMPSGRNFTGAGSTGSQQFIDYKSDIKVTKQTTFTFDTTSTGSAVLLLEYNGANNKRIVQREQITLGGGTGTGTRTTGRTGTMTSQTGTSTTTYIYYGIGILVLVGVGYKFYQRMKSG